MPPKRNGNHRPSADQNNEGPSSIGKNDKVHVNKPKDQHYNNRSSTQHDENQGSTTRNDDGSLWAREGSTRNLRNRSKIRKPAYSTAALTRPDEPSIRQTTYERSSKRKRNIDGGPAPPRRRPAISTQLEKQRRNLELALQTAQGAAAIPQFDEYLRARANILHAVPKPKNWKLLVEQIDIAVGGGISFERQTRTDRHYALVRATALYEDFLYFQTPERRNNYREHIDAEGMRKTKEKKRPLRSGQAPMLLQHIIGHESELRKVLESYERGFVGVTEEFDQQGIGPSDLHTRLSAARRTRTGLGQPNPPIDMPAVDVRVNYEAIEAERRRIEDTKPLKLGANDTVAETHSDRRAREVASFGRVPSATWINDIVPSARDLGRTRLKNGVFLSVGENSQDWNTSYDQLDYVKSGVIAVEPHMIAKVDECSEETESEPNRAERSTPCQILPEPGMQLGEDAEGDLNEFWAPKRPHKQYQLLETTAWTEATYGRREREHAYMNDPPSSPVLSPPHSPIHPVRTAEQTIYIPADVPRDNEEFKKYHAKFRDPYGVNYSNFPHFRDRPKGEGYTIAYTPLDIDALPENLQAQHPVGQNLLNEHGRFKLPAPEGTSMLLLRKAKEEPYRPPGWNGSQPDDEGGEEFSVDEEEMSEDKDEFLEDEDELLEAEGESLEDEEESSEDEGDLFRQSYLHGS